jgi:hypothetical protein
MCTHPITFLTTGLVVALASFSPEIARAQSGPPRATAQELVSTPIGKVVTATGSVAIEHAGAVIVQANVPDQAAQTKVGDLVYLGDVVRTGVDGRVGINFLDGTSFNLSSNANMVLDEYVYDPKGSSNATTFNLTKGTFTFVAGAIAKTGNMKVETPVATMGIRGTTPHIEISDDGSAKFSTLVEQGKSKLAGKTKAAMPAQSAPEPKEKLNLNICRHC